jgi:hypothetical protein
MSKEQNYYILNDHWDLQRGDVIVKMKINQKTTTFTPVGERPRNNFGWQTLKPLPGFVERLWASGKIVLRFTPVSYKHGQTGFIDLEDGSYVLYASGEPFDLVPVEVSDDD